MKNEALVNRFLSKRTTYSIVAGKRKLIVEVIAGLLILLLLNVGVSKLANIPFIEKGCRSASRLARLGCRHLCRCPSLHERNRPLDGGVYREKAGIQQGGIVSRLHRCGAAS